MKCGVLVGYGLVSFIRAKGDFLKVFRYSAKILGSFV